VPFSIIPNFVLSDSPRNNASAVAIVDTHTHVAAKSDSKFPPSSSDLTREWWNAGGTADELLVELDTNSVDRVVFVQAIAAYGYDCSYAAASAAAHSDRAAFVAAIDMTSANPVADLHALCELPPSGARIAGVRLFGVGGVGTTWLSDGRAAAVWDYAAEQNLVVVPTVFANEFVHLQQLAETQPNTRVAIDHCGFTDMVDGDGDAMLFALRDIPSIHLKVTSYALEAAERDDGDPAPLTERLADAFGVDRLCWGSDHPQDQRHDYAGKLALARHATRAFDSASHDAFFNTTGTALFFT